jgi:hypothetical protein
MNPLHGWARLYRVSAGGTVYSGTGRTSTILYGFLRGYERGPVDGHLMFRTLGGRTVVDIEFDAYAKRHHRKTWHLAHRTLY